MRATPSYSVRRATFWVSAVRAGPMLRQLGRDLRSQKLRTFLTTFGIVWGTVAVSLLLAFGNGLHRQMVKNAAGMGSGIVIGWPSMTSLPFEGLARAGRSGSTNRTSS